MAPVARTSWVSPTMSGYDPMSEDYHWITPDELLFGDAFVERHQDLLASLPPDASILDCACGIGSDAIALASRGYAVHGTDASPGLVDQARIRAEEAGVEVRFAACRWEELPERFPDERFDLVLCLGNSISHSPDEGAMLRSLGAMRDVLKDGGTLVVDSRNWEKLRRERPRFSTPDRVMERDGKRCVTIRIWGFPDRWEEPHAMDVALLFLDEDGGVTHRLHKISYQPVRVETLRNRLEEAGLAHAQTDYAEDADWYEVWAQRPNGA